MTDRSVYGQSAQEFVPTRFQSILIRWVDVMRRRAAWVVVLSLLASWVAVGYTGRNLGIDTDTADMISSALPWRQTYIAYKKAFPQYVDTLLVVIDGQTPDIAARAQRALAQRLRHREDLVEWVYLPGAGEFFEQNALLYLETDELLELADNLAAVQPFIARLTREPDITGLLDLLVDAVTAIKRGEHIELAGVMDGVARSVEAVLQGREHELSWWELMLGRPAEATDKRRFIEVKPKLDYATLLPAGPVMQQIRAMAAELELSDAEAVRVRITGGTALAHEELESVSRGMEVASVVALILVAVVLTLGLRSAWLVVASLITLVVGLSWTAAFAALAIGHLNLISVAFAVLYIGLGVQYAIHFCLRYRELLANGEDRAGALRRTASDVGGSLVLCAVTTGIGFFSFVPTDFAGVSELGLISGTGMFISLLATLTLLPALLALMPLRSPGNSGPSRSWQRAASLPTRHRRGVVAGTLLLGVVALSAVPFAEFDLNPLNLRDPESESVRTYLDLVAGSSRPPWTLVVLRDEAELASLRERLEALDDVDTTISIRDFVPADQQAKLEVIEELALVLGLDTISVEPDAPSFAEKREAVARLANALDDFPSDRDVELVAGAERLADATDRLLRTISRDSVNVTPDVDTMHELPAEVLLQRVERNLLSGLPGQIRQLTASLEATEVTLEGIPQDIKSRWIAVDGRYRLEIVPSENLEHNEALRRFVAAVRSVAPDATDTPVVYLESGDAVVRAFKQAFVTALVMITLVLWVLFRSFADVSMVLAPLLLAGLLTIAATVVFQIPFNFANVITLPLLLGVGVDNGIHMVNRMRMALAPRENILQTSTSRAVIISAVTTILSFGNLAFSAHRGTASMGVMLSIGLGFTLVCTLVVLPVLLSLRRRGPARRPRTRRTGG